MKNYQATFVTSTPQLGKRGG